MRAIHAGAILLLGFTAAARAEPYSALQQIVLEHFPGARVESSDGKLRASHETMTYTLHRSLKTGEVLAPTFRQEGPRQGGFILEVESVESRYEGAALVPQILQGPYWATFIDAVPIAGRDAHHRIRFAYRGIAEVFRKEIHAAMPSSRREIPRRSSAGTNIK